MSLGERSDEACGAVTQEDACVAREFGESVSGFGGGVRKERGDLPAMSDCNGELLGRPVRL